MTNNLRKAKQYRLWAIKAIEIGDLDNAKDFNVLANQALYQLNELEISKYYETVSGPAAKALYEMLF